MIIIGLINVIFGLIKGIFALLPNIPQLSTTLMDKVDSVVDTIFENITILPIFIRVSTIQTIIPLLILVISFKHIYHIILWVIHKIPLSID